MNDNDKEFLVDYLVVLAKDGRKRVPLKDARWGELLLPSPDENPEKTGDGMKVVLLASWQYGYIVLETLKEYERRFPRKLNLVGLVTDHPANPDAKISIKKRVWRMMDRPSRVVNEATVIESGLSFGLPVYTGEIKKDSFRELLRAWNPDAIMVCVFGQAIDSPVINVPPYGIYNFHPSDLAQNYGAGPSPYDDLSARKTPTTVWSIHHVSEEIDAGHVVGQSPPMNVWNSEGVLPEKPMIVYNKMAEPVSALTYFLIDELCNRFAEKKSYPIEHIDFPSLFPEGLKTKLLKPITLNEPTDIILFPDHTLFL